MAQVIEITKENYDLWKSYLTNSIKFLNIYQNLLDSYVLDFFTEDLWSRNNPNWQDVLGSFTPVQLANFLSSDESLRQDRVLPLSLQAFRVVSFTYTLPRKPITSEAPFLSYLGKRSNTKKCEEASPSTSPVSDEHIPCNESFGKNGVKQKNEEESVRSTWNGVHPLQNTSVSWGDAFSELSPGAGQHKLLQHVFRRHLKPKKQHEVARLAYIAGKVAHSSCDGIIIDVGSGQGHLSRFLAYGHDVRVVCLEAQDEFIRGAKKFDHQLEMAVEKMNRKYNNLPPLPPPPRHSVCHLEPNMDPDAFEEVVTSAWPELEKGRTCGLLGLHTCGDLAPTLLRIFSNLPTCNGVVSVGCCYMKLTVDETGEKEPGYPMSLCVQSFEGNTKLSYEAREAACHAIEMYSKRLLLGAENLKVHCYRAALEEIIVKHWPEHRHAGLRSVNHAHEMEFSEYAEAAIGRLGNVILNKEDLHCERTQQNLRQWMKVVIFYSMRLMLASVVESVILLDRLFFLYEKDIQSILLPVFDPKLSPRNHVIVAIKDNKEL